MAKHNPHSGRYFRINRMCKDNPNLTTKEHRDQFIARMYEFDEDAFDKLYEVCEFSLDSHHYEEGESCI